MLLYIVGKVSLRTAHLRPAAITTRYECQTTAIKEEVEKCVEKASRMKTSLVFFSGSEAVLEQIRQMTRNRCEYVVVQSKQ